MNAKKTLIFCSPLCCILLSSCEGNIPDPFGTGEEVRLSATIGGAQTLASGSAWDEGDAIGVYMKKSGEALTSSAPAQNVKYETTGDTGFLPADEATAITFPLDGSEMDFIGYYPYKETITEFIYPIDLSNQAVQSDIDLLYSDNARGFNSENPNVEMQFTHQLSKIVLYIAGEEAVNLNELSVIITNTATQASFDLTSGEISVASERGNVQFLMGNEGALAEAILLPENDLSEMELWFVMNEEESEVYKFSLTDAIEINAFEKSTRYTYNVTLFNERTAAVMASDITEWIEGATVSVGAEPTNESPPLVEGSKQAPYTVGEAQEYQGKTGVWVEGYIVGYFSSSSINSFSTDLSGEVSQSNLALADNPGETDLTRIIPVMLGSGSVRNALNLRSNPDNFNEKVKIRGDLGTYLSAPGLRDIDAYEFIEQEQ